MLLFSSNFCNKNAEGMYDFFTITDYTCPLAFRASSMEQLRMMIYKAESYDNSNQVSILTKTWWLNIYLKHRFNREWGDINPPYALLMPSISPLCFFHP